MSRKQMSLLSYKSSVSFYKELNIEKKMGERKETNLEQESQKYSDLDFLI